MDYVTAGYSLFVLFYVIGAQLFFSRVSRRPVAFVGIWTVYILSTLWLAFQCSRGIFDALSLLSLAVFIGAVALLLVSACNCWRRSRGFAAFFVALALVGSGIGLDAFFVEPYWLEVRHETVETNKLDHPIKIAVLSDLQTDHVSSFERQVLSRLLAAKPDLILLPGDYIQAWPDRKPAETERLNRLFRDVGLSAPLGVYAVQGDSESPGWPGIFAGLPVEVFEKSHSVVKDRVVITGLTLSDSARLTFDPPATSRFHILFGHRPDFSLDQARADLLVAGHTHGGQVQLPMFGPLITFSHVPKSWAAGHGIVPLAAGSKLLVTRGVGMERERAPRIRFNCRPEIVIVDVVPTVARGHAPPAEALSHASSRP